MAFFCSIIQKRKNLKNLNIYGDTSIEISWGRRLPKRVYIKYCQILFFDETFYKMNLLYETMICSLKNVFGQFIYFIL